MDFEGALGDGQAEAGAVSAPRSAFDVMKRREELRQRLCRNAGAMIPDLHDDAPIVIPRRAAHHDLDAGARGGVADAVAHDVLDRAAEHFATAFDAAVKRLRGPDRSGP